MRMVPFVQPQVPGPRTVWVNPGHVTAAVADGEQRTTLRLTGDVKLTVDGTLEAVVAILTMEKS